MSDLGNKKIFSNNLKTFMEMHDISRAKLCEDLKLNYSTVSEWITGKKYPRIDKIELLSRYFGCLKSDLIEDKNKSQSASLDLSEIGLRIKYLRENSGITQEQLARKVGYNSNSSRSTINKVELGKSDIPQSKLHAYATALNTSIEYLLGLSSDAAFRFSHPTVTSDYVTFPVIGDIVAGYDKLGVADWSGETVDVPQSYLKGRPQSDYFVLKVKGNSMYPLYHDGDMVLILKQTTLNRSGEIGAVLYDNEYTTLKKVEYVMGEDWLILIPLNPEYAPERIEGARLETCRVIGIPTLLIREIQ